MNRLLTREEEQVVSNIQIGMRRVVGFATSPTSREALDGVIRRMNCISAVPSFDLTATLSPDDFAGDIILLNVGNHAIARGDPLLARLAWLDTVARERHAPLIANATRDSLDALAACLTGSDVTLLCDAQDEDWALAIAMSGLVRDRVAEVRTEDNLRLQRLSEEVERIAGLLAKLTERRPDTYRGFREAAPGFRAAPSYRGERDVAVTADDVRGIVRLRRMRERHFPADLFADPAWDMLLDLIVARLERSSIAVSSLCIAAAVPPTTALRWIKTMTEAGLFVRVADPDDGRRVFIELSPSTAHAMMSYLAEAKAMGGLAI